MTTDNPQYWREVRRLRASELHQEGRSGAAIAEALGVTAGAVRQWPRRACDPGQEALRHRRGTGRPPKLLGEHLRRLPELLARGPEHFGFRAEVWTRARVGEAIRRRFGVQDSQSHVGRLLGRIGWSPQKPDVRAAQCDDERIERWAREDWPRIKVARRERRIVICVDETGFYVLPAVVRTYAPRGQTPGLRAPLLYDHPSAISGITPEGSST
jgi:transposase